MVVPTDVVEKVPLAKEMVYKTILEDLTDRGEEVPTTEAPPDKGEDELEIDEDESKIIKEEFLQHIKDAEVVSKKSGGLFKDQSMSGLNPPEAANDGVLEVAASNAKKLEVAANKWAK